MIVSLNKIIKYHNVAPFNRFQCMRFLFIEFEDHSMHDSPKNDRGSSFEKLAIEAHRRNVVDSSLNYKSIFICRFI